MNPSRTGSTLSAQGAEAVLFPSAIDRGQCFAVGLQKSNQICRCDLQLPGRIRHSAAVKVDRVQQKSQDRGVRMVANGAAQSPPDEKPPQICRRHEVRSDRITQLDGHAVAQADESVRLISLLRAKLACRRAHAGGDMNDSNRRAGFIPLLTARSRTSKRFPAALGEQFIRRKIAGIGCQDEVRC